MGFRNLFKNVARTITSAFGDIPVVGTWTVYGTPTYDEETEITVNPSTEYAKIKVFFTPYTTYERAKGEGMLPTDLHTLIPSYQFPEGFKVAPNNTFTVTSSIDKTFRTGDVFGVVGEFEIDSAEALFIVNLRAVA